MAEAGARLGRVARYVNNPVVVEAHAKINLTLEILGKRHDGYHNLVTVMQTVELHDTVTLEPSDGISLDCSDPALAGDDNLALKAARMLQDVARTDQGVKIHLEKRIPTAAGLGGGSSDAAVVLRALDRLWRTSLSGGELASLGMTVGADVPFLLRGGTALVQGKGDDVTPLPPAVLDWVVILSPCIVVENKTRELFSRVTSSHYTRGLLSHKLAGRMRAESDTPPQFFYNAFEAIADEVFPDIAEYRRGFADVGATDVLMAGAGPSLFAVAPSREIGTAWQLLLQRRGWRAFLTRAWWPESRSRKGAAEG